MQPLTTAAVIGCGDISGVHLAAIAALPGVELVGVCDVDPAALTRASRASGVPGFANHRQLVEQRRPDVVHVCTPHYQHADVAVDCLEMGVNVLLEKPPAHTVSEADRIVEAARSSSAKIGVCFQNRYNETSRALRRLLDSGDLGGVLGGSATVMWHRTADYYRDKPWRGRRETSGGGLLINQAIHTVDLLQWLLGDVTQVRGHVATHVLADVVDVEDTAELVLSHAGGARSVFYGTLANPVDSPVTLEIVTENAVLFLRRDLTVSYADGRVDVIHERQATSVGRAYWGVSHELLISDFYRRLDDPAPFWISPREAAKSMRILADVYALSWPR